MMFPEKKSQFLNFLEKILFPKLYGPIFNFPGFNSLPLVAQLQNELRFFNYIFWTDEIKFINNSAFHKQQ